MFLKGKTALVTGSTSGIGLAYAKALAADEKMRKQMKNKSKNILPNCLIYTTSDLKTFMSILLIIQSSVSHSRDDKNSSRTRLGAKEPTLTACLTKIPQISLSTIKLH